MLYGIRNGQHYYDDVEIGRIVREAQRDILCKIFGASDYGISEKEMRLIFKNTSFDGSAEETKTYVLTRENDPNVNLQIVLKALAEQRWYESERSDQAINFDPKKIADGQKTEASDEAEPKDVKTDEKTLVTVSRVP